MFLPFAGSFLILATGTVVALDALPVVEEVAFDALYGVPSGVTSAVVPATGNLILSIQHKPPQRYTPRFSKATGRKPQF